jgi:hypothetical protein
MGALAENLKTQRERIAAEDAEKNLCEVYILCLPNESFDGYSSLDGGARQITHGYGVLNLSSISTW